MPAPPFLALITPLAGDAFPAHPIVLPPAGEGPPTNLPPGFWPGGPFPPGGGHRPPGPGETPGPVFPAHPIFYPPGTQPPPGGFVPGLRPEHPIYFPPLPIVDPPPPGVTVPEGKVLLVAVDDKGQSIVFLVDKPVKPPPTEPEPKA